MNIAVSVCLLPIIVPLAQGLAQTPGVMQRSQMQQTQMRTASGEIRGEVVGDPGTRFDNLVVDIRAMDSLDGGQSIPLDNNGVFAFDGLSAGTYMIRVLNLYGDVIMQQLVTASDMTNVRLRLPSVGNERPPSGSVSLFELRHKVPAKALKEAREADKQLSKTKNMYAFIAHIQKAVAIDPDYLLARRNLGVAYLKTGQNEEALQQFQAVLERDPHSADTYNAMSAAYLELHRPSAAESSARRALDINPESQLSRYYLGLSLQLQRKNDDEALKCLRAVFKRFPRAHLSAAEILQRLGHRNDAKSELRAYLASGDTESSNEVKSWLSSLN